MISLSKLGRYVFGVISVMATLLFTVIFWKTGAALSSYNFFDGLYEHGSGTTTVAALIGLICILCGAVGIAFLLSKKLMFVLIASVLLFIGTTPFLGMMAREATK